MASIWLRKVEMYMSVRFSILAMEGCCTLFILVTRLDMARNAPGMNIEPVAGLLFGWLILDQLLGGIQIIGGLIVLSGIVLLSYRKS